MVFHSNNKRILHLTRNSAPTGGGPLVLKSLIDSFGNYHHEIGGVFTQRHLKRSVNQGTSFKLADVCPLPTTKDLIPIVRSYRVSRTLSILLQNTFPRRMSRKFKGYEIDLVHTHYPNRIDLQAKSIVQYLGLPMLWTIHAVPNIDETVDKQLREFNRICCSNPRMVEVVAVSGLIADIVKNHCPDVSVNTIHNGVQVEASSGLKREELLVQLGVEKKNPFIICSVGRLNPEKGVEYLIDAAEWVRNHTSNIIFIHLGAGPLEEKLRQSITSKELQNCFFFLGHQRVAEYLPISDLFVLPSLREACSLALLEALFVGLPSIVTNVGGNTEIVNTNCSVIVPPENSKLLAEAILELYSNSDRLNLMRAEAQYQSSRFTFDQMVKKYSVVYERLLDSI